jgi:hypothetical protein
MAATSERLRRSVTTAARGVDVVVWSSRLNEQSRFLDDNRDRIGIALASAARNNVVDGAWSVDCWETQAENRIR